MVSFKKVISILVICVIAGGVRAASVPRAAPKPAAGELSWSCVNDVTCVTGLAKDVMQSLKERRSIDLGLFSVQPVEHRPLPEKEEEGRSSSRALDFLSSNAVQVPVGPVVVNVERSADYPNFVEVSLLRKADGKERGGNLTHQRAHHSHCLILPRFPSPIACRSPWKDPQAYALLRARILGLQPDRLVCACHRRCEAASD